MSFVDQSIYSPNNENPHSLLYCSGRILDRYGFVFDREVDGEEKERTDKVT